MPNVPAPTKGAPVHPVHAANRRTMAARLAGHLRSVGGAFADPELVAWMPEHRRARLAADAGETYPGAPETWAEVVGILRGSSAPAPADPFAGLPA